MFGILSLLAPLAMIVPAVSSVSTPGQRPVALLTLTAIASVAALAAAFTSLLVLMVLGPVTVPILIAGDLGLAVRLDGVSAVMLALVAFVGWVVLRFSATYLDGETRQGAFVGWMCATLAAVMLLVTAGNLLQLVLAWIATSLLLQKLLVFYPERVAAQRAAHKKFVTARIGDLTLIGAAIALYAHYSTGDIATILAAAKTGDTPAYIAWIAGLLAIAALLKSAQFPTHGWLTEVMETPTPVSALLHAGVINAGGFLLIRFADVMILAPGILAALVAIGGFTAVFGGLVMLTQPAIKTALAWSTVAQMGFMILQCGLALFPLALLHIVAHSLYKAHAFLSSGTAVAEVAGLRRPGPVAVPGLVSVGRAFGLALALYVVIGLVFGISDKAPQAVALGAILIFGVAYLLAQGLADAAPKELTKTTAIYSVAVAVGYFALHAGVTWVYGGILPDPPEAGALEWVLIVLTVVSFGAVAFAQATFPLWAYHPAATGLRVHLSNGLYLNALWDRAMRDRPTKSQL